ncbi:MAG TPA: hypothetical protein VJ888_09675, partial [Mobilitalea sp.]|nr:hypothetical protein [Mobilitalea sp.]
MAENFMIIGVLLFATAATIYYLFKKDYLHEEVTEDIFSIDYLKNSIKDKINELTDTSRVDMNLSKAAAKKEEARKLQLIKAVRTCGYGDLNAKVFVKDYIRKLLQNNYGINENTINKIIDFDNISELCVIDKFDILLYLFKREYGLDALYHMIIENKYHVLKGIGSREDELHI